MYFEFINYFVVFIEYIIFSIFSISLLIKFSRMDQDIIGARLFLKKHTLYKNFYCLGIAGSFLALHKFMGIGIINEIMPFSYDVLSESLKTISLVFLIIWMYTWHNMLKH